MIYKKQRNLCVTPLRKEKRNFSENTDTKKITDNKTFLKTVKPFISIKCRSSENINLAKGGEMMQFLTKVKLQVQLGFCCRKKSKHNNK